MNRRKMIMTLALIVLAGAWGLPLFAQNSFFTAEDGAAPFQVKYSGPNTAYIGVDADGDALTIIDGDNTTTLDTSNASYDTITEVIGTITRTPTTRTKPGTGRR